MTPNTSVNLVRGKRNNEKIFIEKLDNYFSVSNGASIIGMRNNLKKLVRTNLFDCDGQASVDQVGSKEEYKLFTSDSSIPAIIIKSVIKSPTQNFKPLIREPKSFNHYNALMHSVSENIEEPYLEHILEMLRKAMPASTDNFVFDVDFDGTYFYFAIEYSKNYFHIEIEINAKELSKIAA